MTHSQPQSAVNSPGEGSPNSPHGPADPASLMNASKAAGGTTQFVVKADSWAALVQGVAK
jgi:hypothetical protein